MFGSRTCAISLANHGRSRIPLMIAFTADHAEGELRADGREILEARWFAPEHLPGLPSPMSMAWRLVEDFVTRAG